MNQQITESSFVSDNQKRSRFQNPQLLQILCILHLIILVIFIVWTVIQLVQIKHQGRLSIERIEQVIEELNSNRDSISTLPVLTEKLKIIEENQLSSQKDLATIIGLLGITPDSQDDYLRMSLLLGRTLNVSFSCSDASTMSTIENCPVKIQLISIEPIKEWEMDIHGNSQFIVPLRIRISIQANVDGYKPYFNLIEIVDDGNPQVVEIALSK